jgi:hypothetical protein
MQPMEQAILTGGQGWAVKPNFRGHPVRSLGTEIKSVMFNHKVSGG